MPMSPEELKKHRHHRPLKSFPKGSFEGSTKRGRKPDPNSKKQKLQKLQRQLKKRDLPTTWSKWLCGRSGINDLLDRLQFLHSEIQRLREELKSTLKGGEVSNGRPHPVPESSGPGRYYVPSPGSIVERLNKEENYYDGEEVF